MAQAVKAHADFDITGYNYPIFALPPTGPICPPAEQPDKLTLAVASPAHRNNARNMNLIFIDSLLIFM